LAGTDDDIIKRITNDRSDFVGVPLRTVDQDMAKTIEDGLQKAQVGCLVVTAASLQRMTDSPSDTRFDFLLQTLSRRVRWGPSSVWVWRRRRCPRSGAIFLLSISSGMQL
jgi:hypothetical protein